MVVDRALSLAVHHVASAPSIMGLFGYGSAAMVTGSWLAGWWGDASSPLYSPPVPYLPFSSSLLRFPLSSLSLFVFVFALSYFAPFVLLYGGIVQLLAALWSFRARHDPHCSL